jgi:hypothetical protein
MAINFKETKWPAPNAPRRERKSPKTMEGQSSIAGGVSGVAIRGRPRIEDRDKTIEARKPWEALGMSRRTWYRRQKENSTETPTNGNI